MDRMCWTTNTEIQAYAGRSRHRRTISSQEVRRTRPRPCCSFLVLHVVRSQSHPRLVKDVTFWHAKIKGNTLDHCSLQICFIGKVMSSGDSQHTVLISGIGVPRLPAMEM